MTRFRSRIPSGRGGIGPTLAVSMMLHVAVMAAGFPARDPVMHRDLPPPVRLVLAPVVASPAPASPALLPEAAVAPPTPAVAPPIPVAAPPKPAVAPPTPAAAPSAPVAAPPPPRRRLSAPAVPAAASAVRALAPAAAVAGAVAADYLALVEERLRASLRYPRRARREGLEGEARVRFRVERTGRLVSGRLEASSGHGILDAEALAALNRAQLPPFPAGLDAPNLEIVLPVRFDLY